MTLGPPQPCPRAEAWLLSPSLDNRALSWVGEQAPSGGAGELGTRSEQRMGDRLRVPCVGKEEGELPRRPLGQAAQGALVKSPPVPLALAGTAPSPAAATAQRPERVAPPGGTLLATPRHTWALGI